MSDDKLYALPLKGLQKVAQKMIKHYGHNSSVYKYISEFEDKESKRGRATVKGEECVQLTAAEVNFFRTFYEKIPNEDVI